MSNNGTHKMFQPGAMVYHYGFKNRILSMDYTTGLMALLSENGDVKQDVHYTQVSLIKRG